MAQRGSSPALPSIVLPSSNRGIGFRLLCQPEFFLLKLDCNENVTSEQKRT